MKFLGVQQIILFAAVASALTLAGCEKTELADMQDLEQVDNTPVDEQYIVVFKTDESSQHTVQSATSTTQLRARRLDDLRQEIFKELDITPTTVTETFEGSLNGFVSHLTAEQVGKLRKRPGIAFIERNRYITLAKPVSEVGEIKQGKVTVKPVENKLPYTTITPLEGENVPWNVERVGYGDGTGKTVWVIDSGVDTDHPDLNIDFSRSRSFIYGVPSFEDGYGHGTLVAGIIAARNNGSGMIGVASNATIVALRIFDDAGKGTTARVITAVNYAVANGQPGDVINISLGGGISSTLDHAVQVAAAKGFRFAIASGNSGVDCFETSPARLNAENVYTISAVDNYNQLWASSNFGSAIDFAAPGAGVVSTKMHGGLAYSISGTSFAAPHVAGILLLRNDILTQGFVIGDKDSTPEPIASSK